MSTLSLRYIAINGLEVIYAHSKKVYLYVLSHFIFPSFVICSKLVKTYFDLGVFHIDMTGMVLCQNSTRIKIFRGGMYRTQIWGPILFDFPALSSSHNGARASFCDGGRVKEATSR